MSGGVHSHAGVSHGVRQLPVPTGGRGGGAAVGVPRRRRARPAAAAARAAARPPVQRHHVDRQPQRDQPARAAAGPAL